MPTRLTKIDEERQERLITWSYAVCDAALARWQPVPTEPVPAQFPHPAWGI